MPSVLEAKIPTTALLHGVNSPRSTWRLREVKPLSQHHTAVGSEPCLWKTARWRDLARQCSVTAVGVLGRWPRGSRRKALFPPLDGNGKSFSSLLPGSSWVGLPGEERAFQNPLTASPFPGASRKNRETPEEHRRPTAARGKLELQIYIP